MKTAYNLLKLSNRKGLFAYEDLVYFFAMVLNAWRSEYPEGKIDFMRFLMDWTRLSGEEIDNIMQDIYNYIDMSATVMDSHIVIVNWKDLMECRIKLAHLMAALCFCVNGRDCFDPVAFNKAFDKIFNGAR